MKTYPPIRPIKPDEAQGPSPHRGCGPLSTGSPPEPEARWLSTKESKSNVGKGSNSGRGRKSPHKSTERPSNQQSNHWRIVIQQGTSSHLRPFKTFPTRTSAHSPSIDTLPATLLPLHQLQFRELEGGPELVMKVSIRKLQGPTSCPLSVSKNPYSGLGNMSIGHLRIQSVFFMAGVCTPFANGPQVTPGKVRRRIRVRRARF